MARSTRCSERLTPPRASRRSSASSRSARSPRARMRSARCRSWSSSTAPPARGRAFPQTSSTRPRARTCARYLLHGRARRRRLTRSGCQSPRGRRHSIHTCVIAYARMTAVKEKSQRARSGRGAPEGGGSEVPSQVRPDPLDPVTIGARVKALRESESLSLRDPAQRSGVSAPMLSQVERGETSPTLTVAARIAAGLELRLSQLLRLDEGGSVTVVHASQRQRGGNARRGHRFEVMPAGMPGQRSDLSRHTLAPGGATGAADDPPMHEPGSRETALVEHGSVVLVCDGQRPALSTGDCVTFDADLPHHFENPGAEDAAFLAVVSAGLRRS